MSKKITKRDLVVIRCVLAYKPNAAGITIKRYVVTDRIAPEYVTAIVSVPGLSGEIRVRFKEEEGQWIPISLTTHHSSGDGTKYYLARHLGGIAFKKC